MNEDTTTTPQEVFLESCKQELEQVIVVGFRENGEHLFYKSSEMTVAQGCAMLELAKFHMMGVNIYRSEEAEK